MRVCKTPQAGHLVMQRLFAPLKHNVHNRWCRLKLIWADRDYENRVALVRKQFGGQLEIVRRAVGCKGFIVVPRRWVVERTFGWFGRYRRLARDHEDTVAISEVMTYLASIRRMLKRATH